MGCVPAQHVSVRPARPVSFRLLRFFFFFFAFAFRVGSYCTKVRRTLCSAVMTIAHPAASASTLHRGGRETWACCGPSITKVHFDPFFFSPHQQNLPMANFLQISYVPLVFQVNCPFVWCRRRWAEGRAWAQTHHTTPRLRCSRTAHPQQSTAHASAMSWYPCLSCRASTMRWTLVSCFLPPAHGAIHLASIGQSSCAIT